MRLIQDVQYPQYTQSAVKYYFDISLNTKLNTCYYNSHIFFLKSKTSTANFSQRQN